LVRRGSRFRTIAISLRFVVQIPGIDFAALHYYWGDRYGFNLAEQPTAPYYSARLWRSAFARGGRWCDRWGVELPTMSITLPQNYRPTDREPFMNPIQQEYFRQKLLKWKAELVEESNQTLQNMQEESLAQPDLADRATAETDRSLELRTRDRFRKLISKIDSAMKSIEEGTYGYCEETGEPIALKRLEARPIATLSVEAQERHERLERTRRDEGAD
jgi:DnaK suppressor protein